MKTKIIEKALKELQTNKLIFLIKQYRIGIKLQLKQIQKLSNKLKLQREEFKKMIELHINNLKRNIKIWQYSLKNWKNLKPENLLCNNPKFMVGRILGLKQELEELEAFKQKLKGQK